MPGKPPRYDNVIIMVGEDQAGLTMPQALMKAVNKFLGYEHVKVSLEVTPRSTGMSFSKLRNILKNSNVTEQDQLEVWSQGFDVQKLGIDWIKNLIDLTRKGMGIQKLKPPVAETRLLNALINPLYEGTSIDTTLRAIINDIGEPIATVYGTMKFMAKKYMENHGELNRGFRMVAAGVGSRWVQSMYVGKLKNELYDLCKYSPHRTRALQEFLRGEESEEDDGTLTLDMKKSFGKISSVLPGILLKLGQDLNAPQLTKNAQRWIQHSDDYHAYLEKLKVEDDEPYDVPAKTKDPRNIAIGQQNVQIDQIVNDILSKIPKNISGNIRNAIARSPNKLLALKAELDQHNIKIAEGTEWNQRSIDEGKKKGKDGKACWKGYRYNGTKNGKDSCVKVSEDVENIMDALINKIIVNEAIHKNAPIQNNKR